MLRRTKFPDPHCAQGLPRRRIPHAAFAIGRRIWEAPTDPVEFPSGLNSRMSQVGIDKTVRINDGKNQAESHDHEHRRDSHCQCGANTPRDGLKTLPHKCGAGYVVRGRSSTSRIPSRPTSSRARGAAAVGVGGARGPCVTRPARRQALGFERSENREPRLLECLRIPERAFPAER